MTRQGFEEYLFAVFGHKTGTAKSYITGVRIIDELFLKDDVFGLEGKSITCINDLDLLKRIQEFVRTQQTLFKKGEQSFFSDISSGQRSYPGEGFCSAAVTQLINYCNYDVEEQEAWKLLESKSKANKVTKDLRTLFQIDKEGKDVEVSTRARLGQIYFRKMVLQNYDHKCCVTGLNVPQILRASHIVPWAENKKERMNPENGLCLSATYDAAFDKHLISFDDDYRMIVSKEIKDYYTSEITKEYFDNYEGKQIALPSLYLPSKKLLEKHRELMIG